jgi:hypothetical protein
MASPYRYWKRARGKCGGICLEVSDDIIAGAYGFISSFLYNVISDVVLPCE